MRLIYIYLLFILFPVIEGLGSVPVTDTIELDGITIRGPYFNGYNAGSRIQRIDSAHQELYRGSCLNDLIKTSAPVYFKSYGSGMLSSISFRGTGAGHTAVLWNGIQVNQPTIGQSDFSLFPVFAFDEINIHYGASSSKYGSEAIGGGILLQSKPEWDGRSISGNTSLITGSYGRYTGLGEIKIQPAERVLFNTRVIYNSNKNNFTFKNITRAGAPEERQKNAAIIQYGIMQDVYVKTKKEGLLSLNGWYNRTNRQIQPSMTNTDAQETQLDKNLRLTLNYSFEALTGSINARLGYLHDYMLYNEQSAVVINQNLGQVDYDKTMDNWKVVAGSKYQWIRASSENYREDQIEKRISNFGGVVYQGLNHTEISVNARHQYIKDLSSPLTPSLGLMHKIPFDQDMWLIINAQWAMNYRVPTLNERFWQPGGNKDLLPEISYNSDMSMSFFHNRNIDLEFTLSVYHYQVRNWIMWLPGASYWVPQNVRRVNASGVELQSNIKTDVGRSDINIRGYYSYSGSIIKKSEIENDPAIGNQLPYTPVHLANGEIEWLLDSWSAAFQADYTGVRFITTDNRSELPGFVLFNIKAARRISLERHLLLLEIRIDNLLNKEYQNVLYRAMPGRIYSLGIHYFIN